MLGRYTTGPVAARAEHSRGARGCRRWAGRRARRRPRPSACVPRPILARCARIDLRSDTVTQPTPAMRRAMADAEVGDDVFGDDPTVNALEERAAELLGKEAGLFVASRHDGQPRRPDGPPRRAARRSIAGARAPHRPRRGRRPRGRRRGERRGRSDDRPDGTLDPAEIEAAFRDPTDAHEPITGLITIENTHAHSMGQPLTAGLHPPVADIAHAHGVPLHIDGARFWNAVVALGVSPDGPRRPGRHGHVLPVEGPRLPGRLGRRRVARRHLASAPRPQAGRWRDAPGRASSPRPGSSP